MKKSVPKGVLLANLGTPSSCSKEGVGKFLREFLMDPLVIPLPFPFRWFLVNGVIVPFRSRSSAKLYQRIWTSAGSPLLVHSMALLAAVKHSLGEEYSVALGMRYGTPSLRNALESLQECSSITVLPLFPQYSDATTGSIRGVLTALPSKVPLQFIPPFFSSPGFVKTRAKAVGAVLKAKPEAKLIFSFHGLPEKQSGADEYRAQCFETARLIGEKTGVSDFSVCFQSRLGRGEWIKPYLEDTISRLLAKGTKDIVIDSPSFATDCLETLEELGMRAQEAFLHQGGRSLTLVPSSNAEPEWVQTVTDLIRTQK